MKKLTALIVGTLLQVVICAQDITKTKVDSVVQHGSSLFLSDQNRVGISIGIFYKGKKYSYHFGTTTKGKQQLPHDSTRYEIGSITKTITGTLLAKAVIEKNLNLEDDVRMYLDGDYPGLEYNGNPVRLVHLLNHSSGLPFMLPDHPELFKHPDYDSLPFILHDTEKKYTRDQFFRDLKKVKVDTVPGIKLSYSNAAAQLLGYILADVNGLSFEELLTRDICRPLGMKHTKLILTPEEKKLLARGYNDHGIEMPNTLSGAAGGIFSTITDMLKYAQLHLNEDNEVVRLSHQPTWGNIQYYAMGLNWQMIHKKDHPRKIFQSGGTGGFSSLMVLYPDLQVALVVLTNESDQSSQGALSKLADMVINSLQMN